MCGNVLDIEEIGGSYLDLNDESVIVRISIGKIHFLGPKNYSIYLMSVIFLVSSSSTRLH